MEIDENAPGNISQSPVTRGTDNETGFDTGAETEAGHKRSTESKPVPTPSEPAQVKPL